MRLLPKLIGIRRFPATSLIALLAAQAAIGQCQPEWLGSPYSGANNIVLDAVEWDPDGPGPLPLHLVIAGGFRVVGDIEAHGVAMRNPLTGQWSALGDGLTGGTVNALEISAAGELLAGGTFTDSGTTPISTLARWDAQTGWQEYAGGLRNDFQLPSSVTDLLIAANGDLIAVGDFGRAGAGSVLVSKCARWDGTTWQTLAGGLGGIVREVVETPNGDLFFHGEFSSQPSNAGRFARFNGSWSAIPSPPALLLGATMLALPNGDLLVAFEEAGLGLQRWNGSNWTVEAPPGYSSAGDVIQLANGNIVVGGRSITVPTFGAFDGLAVWDGTSWSRLGLPANPSSGVKVLLETAAGTMIVGGVVGGNEGLGRNLLEYDFASSELRSVSAGFNSIIQAAAETTTGDLYVAGRFSATPSGLAAHIARLDSTDTWQPLGSGLQAAPGNSVEIQSVTARAGGGIYVAGSFDSAGGIAADGLAAWDGTSWSALPGGPQAPTSRIEDLEVMPNGDLVAAGTFGIRRFDGNTWTLMSGVRATELAVLADGSLAALMGTARVWLFDSSGWNVIGQITGTASHLFATKDGLLLSGAIAGVGGVPVDRVAHYDGTTWSGFPAMGVASVSHALELPDGDLVAFGSVGAVNLALRYSGTGGGTGNSSWQWAADPFQGGLFGRIDDAVVRQSGELVAVGPFEQEGELVAANIARWIPPCPAAVASLGAGCAGTSGAPQTLRALSSPWLGQTYEVVGSGMPANSLAIAVIGSIAPAVPLVPQGAPGCTLNVTPDALLTLSPTNGAARYSIAVPTTPALAGQTFGQQFVAVEFTAAGGLLQLTSSNALATTLGSY